MFSDVAQFPPRTTEHVLCHTVPNVLQKKFTVSPTYIQHALTNKRAPHRFRKNLVVFGTYIANRLQTLKFWTKRCALRRG